MKRKIRNWNLSQQRATGSERSPPTPSTPNHSNNRERYTNVVDDERLEEMEASLKEYQDSQLVHAFIVPNYAEPEGLLRDTIKRLANHRYGVTKCARWGLFELRVEESRVAHETVT